jgi:hypothetical protein
MYVLCFVFLGVTASEYSYVVRNVVSVSDKNVS